DQLDSLRQDQFTITPENLSKLKERLQHYFIWVKTEMANTSGQLAGVNPNASSSVVPTSGPGANVNGGLNVGMNPGLGSIAYNNIDFGTLELRQQ
ncbi:hypothetical protein BGZ58_004347, partial [Dissophora ornata]